MREINYIQLEETLNDLLYDPEIRVLRTGLTDFVLELLRRQLKAELVENRLDDATREEFLTAEDFRKTTLFQTLRENKDKLGLSGRGLQEFVSNAKANRACALDFLEDVLLDKARIRFCTAAKVSTKVWRKLAAGRQYPGEATVDKLRRQLALTPEETERFDGLILRSVFPVKRQLRQMVHSLRKQTGMTVSDFLSYAWVSTDAWEAFGSAPRDGEAESDQPDKVTGQDTLLKLAVGFALDEDGAKELLGTAGAVFAFRKDLVVLAGIRCGYCRPMLMIEILDFFSEDEYGQPYYASPYRA